MTIVKKHVSEYGVAETCRSLGVSRATYYRHQQKTKGASALPAAQRSHSRRLTQSQRQEVLDVLCSPPFADQSPREVFACLLDQGRYLCSIRTMYRILADHQAVRERRNQRRHPVYTKPRHEARAPNRVWTWDITKIKGPNRGMVYSLYVILDLYSRYVVGWLLADRESEHLAAKLIQHAVRTQNIVQQQLTLHADRGAPMTSKTVAQLMVDLGMKQSHSRPRVSNDNPYSEAQFKTLKYRPDFPKRFDSFEHAKTHLKRFFQWYNHEHHHEGIGLFTPADIHTGRHLKRFAQRQKTLNDAYQANPERFVNGPPKHPEVPDVVWINKPDEKEDLAA